MPPFFDHVQLHRAVDSQAVPVLEAMAANDNLRSLRRFERDDPPPYASSTESEEFDEMHLFPPPRGGSLAEELQAILEPPLNDQELDMIAYTLGKSVHPAKPYHTEAKYEEYRLGKATSGLPSSLMFQRLNGARRQGVIIRHGLKRRWQKLGVWNPAWGFAGRKMQPADDFRRWTWPWQPDGASDDLDRAAQIGSELVARALRLRRNLRRGEHAPVLPRSRIRQHTTTSQAEAFLISRPWFIFKLEVAEERERFRRIDLPDRERYQYDPVKQVVTWWKERGDWRDDFGSWVTAWKWRHESPSPEPEDLTPVRNMKDSPLEAAAEMDLTPSEIDELETIDLPRSEQPEGFWVIVDGDLPPFFPGQCHDQIAEAEKRYKERLERLEKARAEEEPEPENDPVTESIHERCRLHGGLFGELKRAENEEACPGEHKDALAERQEDVSELEQDATCPRPRKRRCLRQRQPQGGLNAAQDQEQLLDPPPPRRSTRIAAIQRPAEPVPSQAAPNKRRRATAAPKAAAPAARPTPSERHHARTRPVPARAPPKEETETSPRRGRGRPRKERGPSMPSAVEKKPTRTRTAARTGSGGATGTDGPGAPRRRGRPRKNN